MSYPKVWVRFIGGPRDGDKTSMLLCLLPYELGVLGLGGLHVYTFDDATGAMVYRCCRPIRERECSGR